LRTAGLLRHLALGLTEADRLPNSRSRKLELDPTSSSPAVN
jgi:hypothetical protein